MSKPFRFTHQTDGAELTLIEVDALNHFLDIRCFTISNVLYKHEWLNRGAVPQTPEDALLQTIPENTLKKAFRYGIKIIPERSDFAEMTATKPVTTPEGFVVTHVTNHNGLPVAQVIGAIIDGKPETYIAYHDIAAACDTAAKSALKDAASRVKQVLS